MRLKLLHYPIYLCEAFATIQLSKHSTHSDPYLSLLRTIPAPMPVKFLSLEDIECLSNQEEPRISGSVEPKPWLAKQCNPWWIDPHKDGPAVQTTKLCELLQKIEEDLCALCRQLIADSLTKQKSELADRELFAN